ncbi:polysaccharide deacetylase [Mycobacterium sp. CBMA 213]|nr:MULTISPECIES: polysaccharide deacetylase family protein [unclassified Mycolicibacterium]MUM04711.1 polysaccharide deacetylase [Mycolicibacterium sp. CBMA 213]
MNRRAFLAGLGALITVPPAIATIEVIRSELASSTTTPTSAALAASAPGLLGAGGPAKPQLLPPPPASARVALPGTGVLTVLPGHADLLALTVDDGVDTNVVRQYAQFAKDTGIRLTFFVNGVYRSWTDNAPLLRPLVESGQIQLGNHTWSHPDLTTLSRTQIADQIQRNQTFLSKTFGVDARPYLRPPYGRHNAAVRAVAADLGYTLTTMWSGSLADSTVITEDYIVKMADTHFRPQNIVLGHLNHAPVTHVFDRLADVVRTRNLRTVTFNDVFLPTHTTP